MRRDTNALKKHVCANIRKFVSSTAFAKLNFVLFRAELQPLNLTLEKSKKVPYEPTTYKRTGKVSMQGNFD